MSATVTICDRNPTEALNHTYRRMEGGQPEAWITLVPEAEARTRAAQLEAQGPRGRPLWGVPFAVKDNIDVAGLPTTAACPAFAYQASRTAPAVQRLLDAGAILVGKTNLDQFATGLVGTRSPYGACHSVLDVDRISGGSSSGSAVVVAAGIVPFALGTDTAGSGRVPAAANGIVGVKPSRGLVSTDGVVPACRSIDCLSVFARSVRDASSVLDVLREPSLRGSPPPPPSDRTGERRWRIGVPHPSLWSLEPAEESAYRATLAALPAWAEVLEVDVRALLDAGSLLYGGALVAERLSTLGPLLECDPDALHPVVREVVEPGRHRRATELFADLHRLMDLRQTLDPVWSSVDVLVCPTVPDIPTRAAVDLDPVGANARLGRWTQGVNLLDLCGVTVPAGTREDGLPGSVTVLGPSGSDVRVAAVATRLTGEPAARNGTLSSPTGAAARSPRVEVAVVGAHLAGLPLNHQLTDRGAELVRVTRTAPTYRLYALPSDPPKPGLVRVDSDGSSIEAEVWSLDPAGFASFVVDVPPPLAIGTLTLEDGQQVKGFLCESVALTGVPDITASGSWRAYLNRP